MDKRKGQSWGVAGPYQSRRLKTFVMEEKEPERGATVIVPLAVQRDGGHKSRSVPLIIWPPRGNYIAVNGSVG